MDNSSKLENVYIKLIREYTKAIEANPQSVDLYTRRGVSYYNNGMYNDAINDCTKAIALNPNNAVAYDNRSVSYNKKGMYDNALKDAKKALEINPKYANSHYNLACTYSLMQNKENALLFLENALSFGFEDFDHINEDSDLNFVKNNNEYTKLIKKYSEPTESKIGFY